MAPLVFVNFGLQSHPPYKGLPCYRSRLRGELGLILAMDIGDPRARMRWTFEEYLQVIVLRDRRKLVRWPPHIPFQNLSLLKGGVRTLLELRRLLYSQDPNVAIRFEPRVSDSEPLTLLPSVLHPGALDCLGSHPTSTQPSAVKTAFGKTPRRQRSDVKRRHRRRGKDSSKAQAVGATQVQGRRRPPKRGITSFTFILPETSDVEPRQDDCGSGYYLTDDPIDEFLPEDDVEDSEIEPASEGW